VKIARVILIAIGVALLIVGALVLLANVEPSNYLGIAVWFLGALIIHDGILGPVVFGVSVVMRKSSRRIPFGVLLIVQGALVIGALFTAIVVPEILKQGIGTANATLLPLEYGRNLVIFYGALVGVTVAAIALYIGMRRRKQTA
jgi:hypothetical protein